MTVHVTEPLNRSDLRALRSSAMILRDWAKSLRDGHSVNGEWHIEDAIDEGARREHDRMMKRADDLMQIVKRHAVKPARRTSR